jgi:hypothetical protein
MGEIGLNENELSGLTIAGSSRFGIYKPQDEGLQV